VADEAHIARERFWIDSDYADGEEFIVFVVDVAEAGSKMFSVSLYEA
jgi:hypothetical protein